MIALVLLACTQSIYFPPPLAWDTFDTGVDDVRIRSADQVCVTEGWLALAEVRGEAAAVGVELLSDGVRESHPMWVESTEDGGTTWLGDGAGSRLGCDAESWAVVVWNARGRVEDCMVWGKKPRRFVDTLATEGVLRSTGDCPTR